MLKTNHDLKSIYIAKSILFCVINTALLKLALFITTAIPGLPNNLLSSSVGPVLVLITTFIFLKIDKKSFSDIGLKLELGTLKRFLTGFTLGALVMSIYVLAVLYSEGLRVMPNKNANFLFIFLQALPIIVLLAFMEELLFRAYPLVILENETGQIAAIIITSLLFGFYHFVNGWGIAGFISTGIWGLAFALLAVYSKGISMPTGFHAAGNLVQLALGTTGNNFSIWNTTYKNGQLVKQFTTSTSTTVIAQLLLLAIIIFFIKLLVQKPTS